MPKDLKRNKIRSGLYTSKSCKHFHTNMAKAALSMLPWSLRSMKLKTDMGKVITIHGVDPGWINVDEYYEDSRPWIVPPLDEIDGASRILYPILKNIQFSCHKTRRHYTELVI